MNLINFDISVGIHKDKEIIWIRFQKDASLISILKQNLKVYWSASQKAWYTSDTANNRKFLGIEPKLVGKDYLLNIHSVNLVAMNAFQDELKLKSYSINTIKTYTVEFAALLSILKSFPVQNLTSERLRSYFLYCINELKMKENHLHSRINAIKFYFEKVLKRDKFFFDIPRPKKPSILPKVIDINVVKKMLNNVANIKHRIMLKLCYGMGLRVSEIVNLRITDIDSQRMQVLIHAAKGKKDRYVNLPESVLTELRLYYQEYSPKVYLFEGQLGGQYSIRSVQAVFKKAMGDAKIRKPVGIHSLRHSYATHLMEQGTDINLIKELLGHNDIKTTLIYTHVSKKTISNVKSPLDF